MILWVLVVVGFLLTPPVAQSYSSGSPPGSTGAPGDIATCIQCHGAQVTAKPGWLSSNIPVGGYTYGATYTVSASATHDGAAKIGFEACVVGPGPQKVGTIIVTDPLRTQIIGSYYITHTSGGTAPTNNSNTWSFNWTAPSADVLYATIYACFNAANGDGLAQGDRLYTSELSVFHQSTSGINASVSEIQGGIYPNPSKDLIWISDDVKTDCSYVIFDISGQTVKKGLHYKDQPIVVGDLTSGLYFIRLQSTENRTEYKFIRE